VSRRASLPGADELFRRTSEEGGPGRRKVSRERQDDNASNLQVAEETTTDEPAGGRKAPKHEEKITFYCTASDLMALERARLGLRADHGIAADRGRIVRAALAYVLEDFEARRSDSVLVRRLNDEPR